MEWMIMDSSGLNGLCGSLGSLVDGEYVVADDIHESLSSLLETLQEDNIQQRATLRQLATSGILQQDLVPMVISIRDDPDVFHLAVKLLTQLTQPIECLVQETIGTGPMHGELPWASEVSTMLAQAKIACSKKAFVMAIYTEIRKIFEDAGQYELVELDCESIKQCLLLLRNILHIEGLQGQNRHFDFLRYVLECGLDDLLKELLQSSCRDFWGTTIVQMISLMYRDLVGEVFQSVEKSSSCDETSCDSANCYHCENIMDRSGKASKQVRGHMQASWRTILLPDQSSPEQCVDSDSLGETVKNDWGDTLLPSELHGAHGSETTSTVLEQNFLSQCKIKRAENLRGKSNSLSTGSKMSCRTSSVHKSDSMDTAFCGSGSGGSPQSTSDETIAGVDDDKCTSEDKGYGTQSQSESKSSSSSQSGVISIDEISGKLADFTFSFLQNCFSSLVQILKDSLLQQKGSAPLLDDSYFLWSMAFFLKFARRKDIDFDKIRDVLTTEVFGFLVYEMVWNGEEVTASFKTNKSNSLSMRRLHLSVSAFRELIKTMTFYLVKGVMPQDLEYLESLQRDLSNMADLRQAFLWLVRTFDPSCHGNLFLRDIVVTNHYFLLLLEDWLAKDFCKNQDVDMLVHVKQFAVPSVMQKFGLLLQNYSENDHHVNNCVFTMMYHVAGDCGKTDVLLQPDILQTFTKILDAEFPVTTEMSELMDYVIQKFLRMAEQSPVSCAITLLGEPSSQAVQEDMFTDQFFESEWTAEEMDLVSQWFTELDGFPIMVDKMAARFRDRGIQKSTLEIINYLYKMNLLTDKQLEAYLTSESNLPQQLLQTNSQNLKAREQKEFLQVLEELSNMEESKVLSHCIQKLKVDGYSEQLKYLQQCLLEAAFSRLECESSTGKEQCEPVTKYYHIKEKDIPIIFYSEEQDRMQQSIYMVALMEQLGVHVDEHNVRYPRIPVNLTVSELVQAAMAIGDIDQDSLKFDLKAAVNHVAETTKIPRTYQDIIQIKSSKSSMPSSVAWMRLVNAYNTQGAGGAGQGAVSAGKDKFAAQNMDTS